MSRIKRLTRKEVADDVKALFEKIAQQRGNIPNLYRVYAHRPEILRTMNDHLGAITNTGTVPVRIKELVASLVSRLNHCEY